MVMIPRLNLRKKDDPSLRFANEFADKGLRTLVICAKEIAEDSKLDSI
jgi:hypothetical protein